MEVGALIARCRRRAGLSQRALAERSGTSASAISLYERGERMPRVDTLERIIAATGATREIDAVPATSDVDLDHRGRVLADVLDLADALPSCASEKMTYPVFARMVRR